MNQRVGEPTIFWLAVSEVRPYRVANGDAVRGP